MSFRNPPRPRRGEEKEVQTEASYQPSNVDISKRMTDAACRQFDDLQKLRDMIKVAMTELGGSVYDVVAYKDVILSIATSLPDMPVTDLLLLSSKLFRRTSELGRLLGAFFNNVFAEDFVDEDFHFMELRMARREIVMLHRKLDEVMEEKRSLQELYDELGKGSLDHAKAVEVLENRNDVLELRSSALEDQMAILFQQLTTNFRSQTTQMVQQSLDDIDMQEQLSATRTAFVQSVETVQSRLKFFQGLLVELQEDPILGQDQAFRNKVKSLDVHVQNISNRFGAVREGLLSTSAELVQALQDKRKALNFSVQHLKLYDLQNGKLRQARAVLHELRQRVTDVERMIQHSFPHGGLTRVERNGEITVVTADYLSAPLSPLQPHTTDAQAANLPPSTFAASTSQTAVGTAPSASQQAGPAGAGVVPAKGPPPSNNAHTFATEAADSLRNSKFNAGNVRHVMEQVQLLNDVVIRLTAYLDTEEDQKALLKTISLSVPSTGRHDAMAEKQQLAQLTNKTFAPTAQLPQSMVDNSKGALVPGGANQRSGSVQFGSSGGGGGGGRRGSIRSDSVSPGQNASASTALVPSGGGGGGSEPTLSLTALRDDFTTKLNFLRDVYEERIADLDARNDRLTKKLQATQAELARALREEALKVDAADRDAILKSKEMWFTTRDTAGQDAQSTRSTALQSTREIMHGQVNFGEFSDSRPQSPKSSAPSTPKSGASAFVSPQARLQVQRRNAERRDSEKEQMVVFTTTPSTKRGPMMRTESTVAQQERNEQLIRAMRRLTGVMAFKAPPPPSAVVGGSSPPPVGRRLSTVQAKKSPQVNAGLDP